MLREKGYVLIDRKVQLGLLFMSGFIFFTSTQADGSSDLRRRIVNRPVESAEEPVRRPEQAKAFRGYVSGGIGKNHFPSMPMLYVDLRIVSGLVRAKVD